MNLVKVSYAEIPEEGWFHDTAMAIVLKNIPEPYERSNTTGVDGEQDTPTGTNNISRGNAGTE